MDAKIVPLANASLSWTLGAAIACLLRCGGEEFSPASSFDAGTDSSPYTSDAPLNVIICDPCPDQPIDAGDEMGPSDVAAEAVETGGATVEGGAADGDTDSILCSGGCGPHQMCTSGEGGAVCTCIASICTQAGSACQSSQILATCTVDADGCPYVASMLTCSSPQSCSGAAPSGECSLTCTNSCAQGETACVSGTLATCTMGSNGCWAYGAPVACPGTRQNCTGAAGSAKCACNADPVCTSVAATCSNGSVAICAQDSYGCTYEVSSSPCTGSTPACLNGSCVACSPGATQCTTSIQPQSCDSSGSWQNAIACSPAQSCSNGACVSPRSCQAGGPGLTNCGSGSESCCTSLEVTGGTFYRTYSNTGSGPTGTADPASISNFRLDKYPVTVGRFRQFVAAWDAGWMPPAGSGKHTHLNSGLGLANNGTGGGYEPGWITSDNSNVALTGGSLSNCGASSADTYATWTSTPSNQENLPIYCVNWWEAYAFCIWDGAFLPSEAEWEYAAAGGSQQREYPWGSTAPGANNQYAIYGCYYPSGSGTCSGVVNVAPVGTAAAGVALWGQLDMAGEVTQWTLDWSSNNYVDPCTDCAYLSTATYREVCSNYFRVSPVADLQSTSCGGDYPTEWKAGLGLRCARTP